MPPASSDSDWGHFAFGPSSDCLRGRETIWNFACRAQKPGTLLGGVSLPQLLDHLPADVFKIELMPIQAK
jgi:hypothetical protein